MQPILEQKQQLQAELSKIIDVDRLVAENQKQIVDGEKKIIEVKNYEIMKVKREADNALQLAQPILLEA